jgi:hypothetical protein
MKNEQKSRRCRGRGKMEHKNGLGDVWLTLCCAVQQENRPLLREKASTSLARPGPGAHCQPFQLSPDTPTPCNLALNLKQPGSWDVWMPTQPREQAAASRNIYNCFWLPLLMALAAFHKWAAHASSPLVASRSVADPSPYSRRRSFWLIPLRPGRILKIHSVQCECASLGLGR